MPDPYAAAQAAARWLPYLDPGLHILKVVEELGEAATALTGATGRNPRKGITHTYGDVADELGDVVMAALTAMCVMGADPAEVMERVAKKVLTRVEDL